MVSFVSVVLLSLRHVADSIMTQTGAAVFIISLISTVLLSFRHVADIVSSPKIIRGAM
jgi:uncharacterized membrane-anchored protein